MSIRELSPGKWQVDYYPKGRKGARKRITFRGNEHQARLFESELRKHNSSFNKLINPKIFDIYQDYLAWATLHLSPTTVQDIKYCSKHLLSHFGNVQIAFLSPAYINAYQTKRKQTGVSNRTVNKEMNYLKGIIKYMVKNNLVKQLPFRIEMLPTKRPIPYIPPLEDIYKFFDNIDDPVKKCMCLFMWKAGLRYSEVSNIKWENVDFTSGQVLLTTTKGGTPRICFIDEEIKLILLDIKKSLIGYVFLNEQTGRPYKSIKIMFTNTCKKAGIKHFTPHTLRHAFATYTLQATDNLRAVQMLLGHQKVTTTEFYTQLNTTKLREIIDKKDKFVKKD